MAVNLDQCASDTVLIKEQQKIINSQLSDGKILDSENCFGRLGTLEARLARSQCEIEAAQSLRYKVFVEEMGASPSADHVRAQRDFDRWDTICDHLLVLDTALEGDVEQQIVGTYRLLRQNVAMENGGFYSASEFDVMELVTRHPQLKFMELGRSCVLPAYRTKRTVELLWQGNWAYSLLHKIDVMFGCASFPGTHPEEHALALSLLHHKFPASGPWAVKARPELYSNMNLMPEEAINARHAAAAMPPLIKGYLRLGARFGDGAVIDHSFRTTDVFVVLPTSSISKRYIDYYGAAADRFSRPS